MKRTYNGLDMSFNARMRGGVRAFGGFSIERQSTTCACRPPAIRTAASTATRARAAFRGRSSSRPRSSIRCPGAIQFSVRLPGPERLPVGHGGAGLRRLHRRHRLRPSERPRHVLAGDADAALRGQLHGTVPSGRTCVADAWRPAAWLRSACRWWLLRRSTRLASTSWISRSASRSNSARSRVLPKLDIFNALNSDDYTGGGDCPVRRGDLYAPVDDSAGPHHSVRCRR